MHAPIQLPERKPLRGTALTSIRLAWIILAVFILALFGLSIMPHLVQLTQLPLQERAILVDQIGMPLQVYAIIRQALDFLVIISFMGIAAVIFWSRSNDWMALLVSLALMTFGAASLRSIEALTLSHSILRQAVFLVDITAAGSALLFLYLFPTGRFTPRWTRHLAWFWSAWLLAWAFFPFNPIKIDAMSPAAKFLAFLISTDPASFTRISMLVRDFSLYLVLLIWFGTGVYAQIFRYRRSSTPAEQQQTKGIVFGLTLAFIGYFGYNLPLLVIPALRTPGLAHLLYILIGESIYLGMLLVVPLFIGISVTLYQLWDIDLIINRTLVYSGLTVVLGILYVGAILLLQFVLGSLTGSQSTIAIAFLTLGLSIAFKPLYNRIQSFIDRRFYRQKIDFRQTFTGFSRLVRTIIELPELMRVLVERITHMLYVKYGAVFLYGTDNSFVLAEVQGLPGADQIELRLNATQLGQLLAGECVLNAKSEVFNLLVPLTALRSAETGASRSELTPYLVGVLALGPRQSGLGYSSEDRELLTGLADQAGTAIYVAQLIHERQEEIRLREEAERHLDLHRNSPMGRAESLASKLLMEPAEALLELHKLTQSAGKDPLFAGILSNLPNAISIMKDESTEPARVHVLNSLAEAFNYLFNGQHTPELVPLALRTIISQLLSPTVKGWLGIEEALYVYQHSYSALEANSIVQITAEHEPLMNTVPHDKEDAATVVSARTQAGFLFDLEQSLDQLRSVMTALKAYERVEAVQDKLAYLVSAVESLRHVQRTARLELGSADRAIMQYIAETWLAVITGTISDLHTRARLVCQLLTRHTWQDDVISIGLTLRNEGQGAALNIRVTLAPDPNYSILDESGKIDRLAFGEETQVYLRVRPRLEKGINQFRARFVILYTDPRGPDQVENFADVIHLLDTSGVFLYVSNPYVVGTPLQTGSPLFFGRQDMIAFIQENLAASHRNNLVLIGQRRTGKTSLLKQLPNRLSDEYLPVYIDGQALGLDPGLPSFFLNLATEIAFAAEDRGFELEPPDYGMFSANPASAFERDFLSQVRQVIGNRHLLIMLDEFEELESAVRRGTLDESIFAFLRHLIQHSPDLSVIFCGTHRLEELAADYWNVLFNISIYRHIAFLEKSEAERLIQEPVKDYGMRYDDLALDKIWRITAGHPYFLQLLCHSLVNQHNKTKRSYVTIADVNEAMDEILSSGEAHFAYLWAESSPMERLVLTAMSRMIALTGQITLVQLTDYLEERGITFDRQALNQAFHRLTLRDILSASETKELTFSETFRWKLGLLGMWVEKYKSMSRVIDEAEI